MSELDTGQTLKGQNSKKNYGIRISLKRAHIHNYPVLKLFCLTCMAWIMNNAVF